MKGVLLCALITLSFVRFVITDLTPSSCRLEQLFPPMEAKLGK